VVYKHETFFANITNKITLVKILLIKTVTYLYQFWALPETIFGNCNSLKSLNYQLPTLPLKRKKKLASFSLAYFSSYFLQSKSTGREYSYENLA
jgi:hypothetical protein